MVSSSLHSRSVNESLGSDTVTPTLREVCANVETTYQLGRERRLVTDLPARRCSVAVRGVLGDRSLLRSCFEP